MCVNFEQECSYVAMHVNSVATAILDRLPHWYYFLNTFEIEESQIILKRFWWVGGGFPKVWSTKVFLIWKNPRFCFEKIRLLILFNV